jgi:hypothetical protein
MGGERVHFGDQYPEARFRKPHWSECQLPKLLDHGQTLPYRLGKGCRQTARCPGKVKFASSARLRIATR